MTGNLRNANAAAASDQSKQTLRGLKLWMLCGNFEGNLQAMVVTLRLGYSLASHGACKCGLQPLRYGWPFTPTSKENMSRSSLQLCMGGRITRDLLTAQRSLGI